MLDSPFADSPKKSYDQVTSHSFMTGGRPPRILYAVLRGSSADQRIAHQSQSRLQRAPWKHGAEAGRLNGPCGDIAQQETLQVVTYFAGWSRGFMRMVAVE